MTEDMFLLAFIVALAAPFAFTWQWRTLAIGLIVSEAYATGVLNERNFPGTRAEPMPGEAAYWFTLLGLIVIANLLVVRRLGK